MRRRSKVSSLIKVLSATAAFAAVTSGSVMAFAAEGYTDIQVGNSVFSIDALSDEQYKNMVIGAFNNRQEIRVKSEDGSFYEISLGADADNGIFNVTDGFLPYDM